MNCPPGTKRQSLCPKENLKVVSIGPKNPKRLMCNAGFTLILPWSQGDGSATAGADQAGVSKKMKILTDMNFSNPGAVLVSTHGK